MAAAALPAPITTVRPSGRPGRWLDPIQIREIRGLIADLAAPSHGEERQTVILSTHIMNEVEAICQRVILINNGRKALDEPIETLTAHGQSLEEVFARVTSRDESQEPSQDAS